MLTPPPLAIVRQATRSIAEIEADIAEVRKKTKLAYGRLLLEAKASGEIPHGQWQAWLTENGFATRTAQQYMKLAKSANLALLSTDADPSYSDLGLRPAHEPGALHYSVDKTATLRDTRIATPTEAVELRPAHKPPAAETADSAPSDPSPISDAEIKQRGIAVNLAQEAIDVLKKIHQDSGYRDEAFEMVLDFIQTNREVFNGNGLHDE